MTGMSAPFADPMKPSELEVPPVRTIDFLSTSNRQVAYMPKMDPIISTCRRHIPVTDLLPGFFFLLSTLIYSFRLTSIFLVLLQFSCRRGAKDPRILCFA